MRIATRVLSLCLMFAAPPISLGSEASGEPDSGPAALHFEFSSKQQKQFSLAVQSRSKADFTLTLRHGENGDPVAVRAHLRGQGSLRYCARKSYTIDLLDQPPAPLLPDSFADQFYLISMCQDEDYLRTATVMRLWRSLDLFPLSFGYVELFHDGVTQGLYLLLEKPANVLPRKSPDLSAIIRRRFDPPFTYPEVEFSIHKEAIAAGDYVNTLLYLQKLDGQALVEALESRLDLSQFILHLAVAAALYNGDYIDEIWFLQIQRQGGYYYRVMKWDPDDVLRACHYGDRFAWRDPHGITLCAESELARLVLNHPSLYRRFVDRLALLIDNELAPDRFETALNKTATELEAHLNDEEIVVPMEQFSRDPQHAADRRGALAQISATREALSALYRRHVINLGNLIERYRQNAAIEIGPSIPDHQSE